MAPKIALIVFALMAGYCNAELPTLYQHYTAGGVVSGLVPTADGFLLNGKPFHLVSGAIHYFRVHPAYWRDRLRKLRASGVTTVETYVAWNLHEPQQGVFDFGQGKNDMSMFLDLVNFIKMAQEEDLFVIFRPGPFICSEWDFGGLPSWLLRDHTMHVRTMYSKYIERADAFFEKLMPLVIDMQFTSGNGSIIAVQVENEYGAFGYDDHPRDTLYLEHLLNKMKELGLREMFFTSDSPLTSHDWGSVKGALQTANFQTDAVLQLNKLRYYQPNMPLMVTEFWSGWYTHWGQQEHGGLSLDVFEKSLGEIFSNGASVNFYMFHGGTNFGFMNGANIQPDTGYEADVTSYDYDAPLSEAGDYTDKYFSLSKMIPHVLSVQTRLPAAPPQSQKMGYPDVEADSYLTLDDLIGQVPKDNVVESRTVLAMEDLPINNMNGQSYGFIVYRKTVDMKSNSTLQVRNHVRDLAQVLVNGQLQTPPILSNNDFTNFGSWYSRDASFTFGSWRPMKNFEHGTSQSAVMDVIVENLGRVNYGEPHYFQQKKGLWEGPLLLDGEELTDFQIVPLEFKGDWVRALDNWRPYSVDLAPGPKAVRYTFNVIEPLDTFVDMSAWGKGVVFVNGFNLGRYWSPIGPQKTLYLPGPLLNIGRNEIVVYEQFAPASKLIFSAVPLLGKKNLMQ